MLIPPTPIYESLIGKRPEGSVYHYTSHHGLFNILRNGKLWTTDFRYFSDSSEFIHAFTFAREFVAELRNAEHGDRAEFLEAVQESLKFRNDVYLPFYVACFCEEPDNLDLWRAYCPPDTGYCFGFDWNAHNDKDIHIGQCIYTDDKKRALLKERLWKFFEVPEEDIQAHGAEHSYGFTPETTLPQKRALSFVMDLLHYAALFKHYAFRSEREWRVVVLGTRTPKLTEYRPGSSLLVPYVNIELFEGDQLRIDGIWVGPTRYPRLAIDAVEGYVNSLNNEERPFRVECTGFYESLVPYRTL